MTTKIITTHKFLALCIAGAVVAGCRNKDEDPLPFAQVNEVINVTNMDYIALRNDNGTVAIPGGVRGILVVRQSPNLYYAFERNCTFQPYDSCATVSLASSRLFLEDECCSSQFNFDGTVRTGPASRNLVQYTTSLSGNLLYITN